MANKIPVLVWTVCVLAIISNGECASRQKRSLAQFGEMINCASGGTIWDYIGYGCYCGKGGGGTPVDATDWCCYSHDQCYDRLRREGTCSWSLDIYLVVYRSSQSNCGSNNPKITCRLSSHRKKECADGLCECDREAALCFRRNRNSLSDLYRNYNKGRYC